MRFNRYLQVAALLGIVAISSTLNAQAAERGPVNQYGNPMKLAPRPTGAAINEADLRTRLYIFADDSMMGRATGTLGNEKGTNYLAAEAKRLGLEPAGDNGTYFQVLPYGYRYYGSESQLSVDGRALRWAADFANGGGTVANVSFQNAQVIYGGIVGDTARQIPSHLAVGRFVILTPNPNPPAAVEGGRGGRGGGGGGGGGGRGGRGGRGDAPPPPRFLGAAGVATVDFESMTPAQVAQLGRQPLTRSGLLQPAPQQPAPGTRLGTPAAPPNFRITRAAAEQLMGVTLTGLEPGAAGLVASGRLVVVEQMTPTFGRNVVAILRGSDPVLKNQFVAIGAHNDHDPMQGSGVDHDSTKAYLAALYALRMADGKQVLAADTTLQRMAREKTADWSKRRTGPVRLDSIKNGADDDGSGSMAVLEIAEALSLAKEKPKRSIIFVWHTGEETGLQGSAYFMANPTVPRDSIVANLNMDMIGRGRADDIPGGGPDYLAVVGSNRLSSELSAMVVAANKAQRRPMKLDYQFDDSVTWAGYNNIYGRSDHANYARRNIPIAFFFTGLHADYHQFTDEPQYIDYPHYSRIVNYIRDLTVTVANSPTRPKVDPGRIAQ